MNELGPCAFAYLRGGPAASAALAYSTMMHRGDLVRRGPRIAAAILDPAAEPLERAFFDAVRGGAAGYRDVMRAPEVAKELARIEWLLDRDGLLLPKRRGASAPSAIPWLLGGGTGAVLCVAQGHPVAAPFLIFVAVIAALWAAARARRRLTERGIAMLAAERLRRPPPRPRATGAGDPADPDWPWMWALYGAATPEFGAAGDATSFDAGTSPFVVDASAYGGSSSGSEDAAAGAHHAASSGGSFFGGGESGGGFGGDWSTGATFSDGGASGGDAGASSSFDSGSSGGADAGSSGGDGG